ncbi:MAG TPA: S-layer homology domain-containing protein, partial [Candidatus Absconditabacterales bacterium]|nr:S-layer homology domain-containing protein [Candidatus Absconditabacterales bacterium]
LLATETANFTLNGSDMVGSLSNIATTNTTTRPVTLTAGDGWKVINVVYSTGTKISQSYPAFIYLDQTAPGGGSFLINNGASSTTSQSVTLTITCPYDISSPVKVSFGESASPSNFTSCGSSINMSLSAGNGLKTVYLRFTDNLGNQTTDLTQTITLNASIVTPPNPGGGGGGGGGGGITPDVCPGGDFSPSYYDRTCGTNPNNNNPINPNPGNSTDVYTNYSSTDGFIPTGTTPYERLRSIILRYKLLRMPYKDRPYNKIIFGDIANDSNNLAIKTLKNYGIIQGYGASNFKPNTQITYAEFLKILVRTSNTPATYTPREGFDNKWYQIYLDKAKRDGWLDKSVTNPHAAITERALLGFIKKSFEVMGRTFSIPQSTIDQAQGTVSRSELTKIVTALFMLSYRDSAITAGNNTPLLERLAEIIKNDTPQVQFNKIWELVQRLNGINASVLWKNYAVDKQFLIEDLLKTIPRT